MDIRKVKKLIDLLQESGISEIEIKEGEESVRISRQSSSSAPVSAIYHAPAPAAGAPAADTEAAAETKPDGHVINAPMVGTFYSSPSPSTPSFVTVGSKVRKGDVLCIIEAMKIMNQIESDRDGTITAVLTENGQPVEYGQPLFVIK
jgi:acetyl-CoA carboxylase biotin carboxyl carrier protein